MGNVLQDPQLREAELRALVAGFKSRIRGCAGEKRGLYHVVWHLLASDFDQPQQNNRLDFRTFRDRNLTSEELDKTDVLIAEITDRLSCFGEMERKRMFDELISWTSDRFLDHAEEAPQRDA